MKCARSGGSSGQLSKKIRHIADVGLLRIFRTQGAKGSRRCAQCGGAPDGAEELTIPNSRYMASSGVLPVLEAAPRTRRRPEQDLQKALADHLRARAAAGTACGGSIRPGGGARTAIEGAIMKACGVRAGTPDLILIRGGKTFGLELKAGNGRVSPTQASRTRGNARKAGADGRGGDGIRPRSRAA